MANPLGASFIADFVRPAIPDNGGVLRRPVIREAPKVEEPPTITIEGSGLTELSYSGSKSSTYTVVRRKPKTVELRRVFDEVKITNKDDDSQFVEVEVLREVELGKEGKKKGRKYEYDFEPPAPDGNYEVTKANQKREAT